MLGGNAPGGPDVPYSATASHSGHTVLDLTDVDLKDLREIREIAAARIAERREELAVLEDELAVLDEALEEAERDRPRDDASELEADKR